ncbi:MAG: vitamin K epoxide reductase family protein [Aphanocapsa feldmannii 277cV]|uniref:Vitamin K epoxide reductase family protein n=1 Tax=Aphanocapsa feldmannii 277cV TaxID=2507553 RepID=A0A524RQ17_9CHRO|nr:MAG: vitamin K epoxide reductase family protein [Aphanocapsa feldmannii 277cV]
MGSTRLGRRHRQEAVLRWPRLTMAALASVGAVDTGVITLKHWNVIPVLACPGSGEGCDKVLNSAWGTAFGQPLSLFGCLAYLSVIVLALLPLLVRGDWRRQLNSLTWPSLVLISCAMAVFSISLMGLLVFEIQAFCFFCVLSAVLSLSLLLVSVLGRRWEDMGNLLFRGLIVAVLVGLGSLAWIDAVRPLANSDLPGKASPEVQRSSTADQVALADHLTDSGATVYTAYWCHACSVQKELFGKQAVASLDVVECAADGQGSQPELCETKGVVGYPTWEIKGVLQDSGVKQMDELADLSGYQGDRSWPRN